MDDQFLHGLREAPSAEFAARLRARLQSQNARKVALRRTALKLAASVAVVVVTGSLVIAQLSRVTDVAPTVVERAPSSATPEIAVAEAPTFDRGNAQAPPPAAVSKAPAPAASRPAESADPLDRATDLSIFRGGREAIPDERARTALPVEPAPAAKLARAPTTSFAPGTVFRDCDACPEMVVIPAGSFQMRDDAPDVPVINVTFPRPFALGKTEVTFAEWDACVAAGACTHAALDQNWGRATRPVINVSWHDAQQYVAWLSQQTGAKYRLPKRTEWDYAARAGTTTRFPWGDEIGRNNANCFECGSEWDGRRTAPAASFAANQWGLHDLYGNVKEWVEDCLVQLPFKSPAVPQWTIEGTGCKDEDRRVMRGGGFLDLANNRQSLATLRKGDVPTYRKYDVGFRVARTLD